jgi:hypothetical protein
LKCSTRAYNLWSVILLKILFKWISTSISESTNNTFEYFEIL